MCFAGIRQCSRFKLRYKHTGELVRQSASESVRTSGVGCLHAQRFYGANSTECTLVQTHSRAFACIGLEGATRRRKSCIYSCNGVYSGSRLLLLQYCWRRRLGMTATWSAAGLERAAVDAMHPTWPTLVATQTMEISLYIETKTQAATYSRRLS